jgi:putative colanic acid biosynthesis UDP-glucose lipid carrier transferase
MNYSKPNFRADRSVPLDSRQSSAGRAATWAISYNAVEPLAMALDALLIFSMSILSGVAYHFGAIGLPGEVAQFSGFASVVAVLFIALVKNRGLYELTELLNLKLQLREITLAWGAIFLFLTGVAFTMKIGDEFSRGTTLIFAGSGFLGLTSARIFWRIFLADSLTVRKFSGREVMLIEEHSADPGLLKAFARHGMQLSDHFVLPIGQNDVQRRKDVIAKVISAARGSDIKEIVVSANLERWSELKGLLSELRVLPIPVNLMPRGPISELLTAQSHTIGDTISIELQRGPRTLGDRAIKRFLDIVIASTALVLLGPLLLMTAVAIKLDSTGPVMFRQRRCGFNGKQFQIFKFRTMSVMEDGEAIAQARQNDPRITRIGHLLRRTSIDELPQLLNVLMGSMSIVGPRPHAVAHDHRFDQTVINYTFRNHVKPGLTGWAQVHGCRGETRTAADIEKRVKFDLWYIDNWNVFIDFKIILMTATEIVRGENAY